MAKRTNVRNNGKLQEVANRIRERSTNLLGEIIAWDMEGGGHTTYLSIVSALDRVGLDKEVAKEFTPEQAFSRACKELSDERIIDVVREDAKEVVFQFTKKSLENEEWIFAKETYLRLDKNSGAISCPNRALQTRAQETLNKCMATRTMGDVSRIVRTLFGENVFLSTICKHGRTYFVPWEHHEFVEKVDSFLKQVGGTIKTFPIADVESGRKSVANTICDNIEDIIKDHFDAIEELSMSTRPDTFEKVKERIQDTRTKVEGLAYLLGDAQTTLHKALDKAGKALNARINGIAEERSNAPVLEKRGEKRTHVFGYPITAVIRWMGKEKWSFEEAKQALCSIGCTDCSDSTIRCQLLAGRKGKHGNVVVVPAEITKEQAELLKKGKA